MKKKIIIGALILGGLVGGYFGVRYEIKVYNTVILENQRINVLEDFVLYAFPDQVDSYQAVIKAKQAGSAPTSPLPAKPATKK